VRHGGVAGWQGGAHKRNELIVNKARHQLRKQEQEASIDEINFVDIATVDSTNLNGPSIFGQRRVQEAFDVSVRNTRTRRPTDALKRSIQLLHSQST
jgi:hypothetical protein